MTATFAHTVLKTASMAAVPFVMLAAAVPAAAQSGQRMLFEWRGDVDQEVRIQMQNGRTDVMPIGPRESVGYDNARSVSSVPSVNGYVSVRMLEGRGIVDVVQQPRSQNGYTTIVRIRDDQSGRGQYDIQAFWQPNGNYGNSNYNVYNDRAYNDGGYSYDQNYDPYYDPYYNGQYGAYGAYGAYGGYYGSYPRTVIVERPVQRPVYIERRAQPRSVPVAPRGVVSPPREATRRGAIPPGFPVPRVPVSRVQARRPVRTPPPPPRQSYNHGSSNHSSSNHRGH